MNYIGAFSRMAMDEKDLISHQRGRLLSPSERAVADEPVKQDDSGGKVENHDSVTAFQMAEAHEGELPTCQRPVLASYDAASFSGIRGVFKDVSDWVASWQKPLSKEGILSRALKDPQDRAAYDEYVTWFIQDALNRPASNDTDLIASIAAEMNVRPLGILLDNEKSKQLVYTLIQETIADCRSSQPAPSSTQMAQKDATPPHDLTSGTEFKLPSRVLDLA